MIVKHKNGYLGLHQIDVAVLDTSRESTNFLKIDSLPYELTAGKNLFKINGNSSKFKQNTFLHVEVIDSNGETVYVDYPNYYDSLKRKPIIITVDETTAPGLATITICSVLRDELVPPQYRDKINFKWQYQLNISPFKPNDSEIIFVSPPSIELYTRVRPYITNSFRNNQEMISYEYGDYSYNSFIFDDHTGTGDGSSNIFQRKDSHKILNAFTSGSITSFNRDTEYYLRDENFSARQEVRNYSIITPGTGFYGSIGPNLILDSGFENTTSISDTSYWFLNNALVDPSSPLYTRVYGWTLSTSVGRGNIIRCTNTASLSTYNDSLQAGAYYLVSLDINANSTNVDFDINLGYSTSNNSGSIHDNVTSKITLLPAASAWVSVNRILRCSDSDKYLWISASNLTADIDNIRLREIASSNIVDFPVNSDLIGGILKVNYPIISPTTQSGYIIESGDPSYVSYIDFVFENKTLATTDRFEYTMVDYESTRDPKSYTTFIHPINSFGSNKIIGQQLINNNLIDVYGVSYSVDTVIPSSILVGLTHTSNGVMYGNSYLGGINGSGGIFKYDVGNNQFSIVASFNGFDGKYPASTLLYLPTGPKPGLYGTTYAGGIYNSGSLFRFDLDLNTITRLYSFTATASNGVQYKDTSLGYNSDGPVIQASNGLLYGMTPYGGAPANLNAGVLYSFNTGSSTYTKLVDLPKSFGSSELLEYSGSLWGFMPFGGTNNSGSIFEYQIASNTLTERASFTGTDGYRPNGAFLIASDGNWYSTTISSKVAGVGCHLFKFDTASYTITNLANIDSATVGTDSQYKLIEDRGLLYGVCASGGVYGYGSVFSFNTASSTLSVVHSFGDTSVDGLNPKSGLIRYGNSLYGVTNLGGGYSRGSVFNILHTGINSPYVEHNPGMIYHHNSIIPQAIPSSVELFQDYPRWTEPIDLGQGGIYSIVELEIQNLNPLSGDISKINLSAKPKGAKGDYVDLGTYTTTPTDVLLDTYYLNHVPHIDSPYRLTGFFKPTITPAFSSSAESSSMRTQQFLDGTLWSTGSITNAYFVDSNFHNNLQFIDNPALDLPEGSIARMQITSSANGNGMAYLIYKQPIPPDRSAILNTWQQISYELFSAYPFTNVMDSGSYNFYTGSSAIDKLGINNLLVYSALFKTTESVSLSDLYSIPAGLSANAFNTFGISESGSYGEHPYIFNTKLGHHVDDFLITADAISSGSLYIGLVFEYNSSSNAIFGNTLDSNNPNILDVKNIISRELGDREYMINKYWEWYSRAPIPETSLSCSAVVTSNNTVLMDSAKITSTSSIYAGSLNKNTVVLQTKDSYKFIEGVPYILSFNAVSKINELPSIGDEVIDNTFLYPINGPGPAWIGDDPNNWSSVQGEWISYSFKSNAITGSLIPPTGSVTNPSANTYLNGSAQWTYGAGTYIVTLTTGEFTYSTIDNPTSFSIEWPAGNTYEIRDIQPFSTYTITIPMASETTDIPVFRVKATYSDSNATVYILGISIKPYQIQFDITNYTGTEYITDTTIASPTSWTSGGFWFGTSSINPGGFYLEEHDYNGTGVGVNQPWWWAATPPQPLTVANPGGSITAIRYSIDTGEIPTGVTGDLTIGITNGGFPASNCRVTINNVTANTTYTGDVPFIFPITSATVMVYFTTTSGYVVAGRKYRVVKSVRLTADPISSFTSRANPIIPATSKLTAYGINSMTYGAPFRDQLSTIEIGEFIGELEHTKQYSETPEVKNFGKIEMEFEAEKTGYGKIGFETSADTEWYLSEISVKPKDRVGITPGYTRLFIRVPNSLVNVPLTFKVEYLNDSNIKAPYNTMLNDITFTNKGGQYSDNGRSLVSEGTPGVTRDTSFVGPNTNNPPPYPGAPSDPISSSASGSAI